MYHSRPDLFPPDALPEASESADITAQTTVAPPVSLHFLCTASVEAPVTPNSASFDCLNLAVTGQSSVKSQGYMAIRH